MTQSRKRKSSRHIWWTPEADQTLLDGWLTALKEDLLKRFPGRTWSSLVNRAHILSAGNRVKAGLRPRKWYWDFDYFEYVDTPEKAYWLGFIYADGSLQVTDARRVFHIQLENGVKNTYGGSVTQ